MKLTVPAATIRKVERAWFMPGSAAQIAWRYNIGRAASVEYIWQLAKRDGRLPRINRSHLLRVRRCMNSEATRC